ncbi:hypothetical protein QTJ16_002549 [Diplocarpon rosae]|uniref:Uncharacterized protein n=1 Tax=Diplocarpon rosae TaxID=946125 RepID=A0AAD9WF44_9HELO|nr:hypothetical protein QTJ16_002549 [Diplocarpon rosae]
MAGRLNRTQLIKDQLTDPGALSRPVLTYINGDVSWLVSFPRPESGQNIPNRKYYHVLIDPWFGQASIFISSLVLEMETGRDPWHTSRLAVDDTIAEIELAAGNSLASTEDGPVVDAIFVTAMAEHCHQGSLLQFSASTPVFAVAAPARTIASWGHFDTVVTMCSFDPSKSSWKEGHPGAPLPAWLTAFPPTVTHSNNFGLVLITSANSGTEEMILMAPHGIYAQESSINALGTTVKMLALVAPLKDSYAFGMKQVLGVEDGLAIAQAAGTRYYVRSGDFVSLKYKGVIGWSVKDVPRSLQWGVDQRTAKLGADKVAEPPILIEIENGGSFVLM